MKKLVVLAAAVALGLSAQAAALDWSMTVASTAKGYQTMFFDYGDLATVQGILDAGGSSTLTSLESYAIGNPSGTKEFATGSKSTTQTGMFSIDKGTDVFAVVFDTKTKASITDGMTYGMSGKFETTSKIYDPNGDPPEASPGTFSFNLASGLTTGTIGGAVPEPTSGLLMLVGLGALALRRRRA